MRIEVWTDISAYQNFKPRSSVGPLPIDFAMMKAAGIVGVCMRKHTGYYRDVGFEMNWADAKAAGLKRTFYGVPFVGFDMIRQLNALRTLSDGSAFDPTVADSPPWDDVEYKHRYGTTDAGRQKAINQLMGYHTAFDEWVGTPALRPRFYTAKYVWQDYYSKLHGWGLDWGLVVANYQTDLYSYPLMKMVELALTRVPMMPVGYVEWAGWQIAADGNGQGARLGVHSRDVDITVLRVPDDSLPPPEPNGGDVGPDLSAVKSYLDGVELAMDTIGQAVDGVRDELGI